MHYIIELLGGFGATVIEGIITFGSFAGAIAAGYYADRFTRKAWVGWGVGILVFVLMVAIFGPIYNIAKRMDCREFADDYQACTDDDN